MALLDSMLAENFHAAYRQKRSGVLTAEGAALTMRFCFQDGSPIAIDLGDDKDRLLANTLRDYNRLTDEQLADVISSWEAGQAAAADLVVARGYASEEEVGRSTQAMVEDSLCRFFSGKINQVELDDQKTIDGFDFDRRAFRLKIDAEVLLRTVDTRVAEIRTIQQEFGNFEAIFVFNEDSPGSGALTEFEKRILDFVDGRTTVQQIAVSFRDSNLNTARTLAQLASKKIIRRIDTDQQPDVPTGGATGLRQALSGGTTSPGAGKDRGGKGGSGNVSAARAAVAAAAMRQATPTMRDFTPYRQTAEEPRSRFMTVVLALVLVVLGILGVLIYQYNVRQREFAEASQRLEEALGKSDWSNARQQLDEARIKAGKDLSAQQRVDEMEGRLKAAIDAELAAIEKLSNEGEHQNAGTRLSRLPTDEKVDALRSRLARNQAASAQRSRELAERVAEPLEKNSVKAALAMIAAAGLIAREQAPAVEAVDRWRIAQLEMANSNTARYGKRLLALSLVRGSEPPKRLVEQLPSIEADLARQETRLRDQLVSIKTMIDKGATDAAVTEIERLGLIAQVEETPLASQLTGLQERISDIRKTIAGLLKSVAESLSALDKPEKLVAAIEQAKLLSSSTITGVGPKADACIQILTAVNKIPTDQLPDAQAAALAILQEQPALDPVLVEALKARAEKLRGLEGVAAKMLDNARALGRDSKLEEAVSVLDDLLGRNELRSTTARTTAVQEIDELKARLARRLAMKDQLKAAMAKGDVATTATLSREMGLKYLPLSIESLPVGAEVWHDNKQIGTTPLVIDISAADRVDYQVELKFPGYTSAIASGAKAEAGWRLLVRLERHAANASSLGGLVTNHPTAIGERVVAASRSAIGVVDTTGKTTWVPFAGDSVDSPVYAAAVGDDQDVLLATRDQIALVVTGLDSKPTVRRVSLAGRTDFPLAFHRSSLIVDRRMLLIAGLDGSVHATDEHDSQNTWQGPTGAPFLCGPKVLGDTVLTVRKDGTIERLQADDGKMLSNEALGTAAVTAWTTATGIAGYTANELYEYDGETLTRTALPQVAVDGVADLIITPGNRVLLRATTGDRAWDEVGRLEEKLTGVPFVWQGHAVLPTGTGLTVFGPRGFHLAGKSEFLSATVLKDRLVVISQDGQVQQFDR